MNDEPMMIDETENEPTTPRATAASWKKAQLLVAGLAALFAISIVVSDEWHKTFDGPTKAQVAEFEQEMNDYFDEAQSQGVARVTTDLFEPDQRGAVFGSTRSMTEARERLQEAARDLGYQNATKAKDMFTVLAVLHNDSMPMPKILTAEQVAEIDRQQRSAAAEPDFDWTTARPLENDKPWVMRDIPAGLWATIQAAVITFVAVWLLLWLCELLWWFLMDRLHDVANAVRRS
jgi:hypothetical protein